MHSDARTGEPTNHGVTLEKSADALAKNHVTSVELVRASFDHAANLGNEAANIFPYGFSETAMAEASRWDEDRAQGKAPRLAGIPISIKDNIARAREPLRAGSRFLEADQPASRDAPLVDRLNSAGFVTIGRTNMTELAFSGLGLNPHFGTPANPAAPGRAPGGSSAGAATSVAAGLVHAAIGTDTSGSCRIPAAFCGLVGFKPTAHRIPLPGVYPLSPSLDSVGVIANSVDCCAKIDAIIAGGSPAPLDATDRSRIRIADLSGALLEDTQPAVISAYGQAVVRLRAAGIGIETVTLDILSPIAAINCDGGFGAVELYRHLADRLETVAERIDPRVLRRIRRGEAISDARYRQMVNARTALIAWANDALDAYDAVIMPTVAIVPPPLDELRDDLAFDRFNMLALRNAGIANILDRCAISIPCHSASALPVGLTLMGPHNADRALLSLATDLESIIRFGHMNKQ
ncbi:amidase [Sphingobium sp. H39-3-25]|uniref:amidase n=1 Tax=Sphingobium arseniciresistens TaxID=3030834 RepID=UPI0023B9CF07|nr:amidase [Sphingobium arseniciresistens]